MLGIDTSGADGSLALARIRAGHPASRLGQVVLNGRHCSAELIPQIKQLFSEAEMDVSDLAAIVVVNGPGSFTGLRIGISAAKALAEAKGLPVIALSRLELLSSSGGNVAAVLDAGRGEYYLRIPAASENTATESLVTQPNLLAALHATKLCVCEPELAERLSRIDAGLELLLLPSPQAFDAICVAEARYFAEEFEDVAMMDANYVRKPYAQMDLAQAPAVRQ